MTSTSKTNDDSVLFELSNGSQVMVSAEDVDRIKLYKWNHNKTLGYATKNPSKDIHGDKHVYMHRFILGLASGDGKIVDHINGNGLDNRRSNLRLCTKTQNQQNQKPRHTSVSKYKGVGYYKRDKKWRARIIVDGLDMEIGKFETELEAAVAYDTAAKEHHREFAWLNEDHFDL